MDPVNATRSTAQSIFDFGAVIILAAAFLVLVCVLLVIAYKLLVRHHTNLEAKVEAQERRIAELSNGQREALERRLDESIKSESQMCHAIELIARVIERCPGGGSVAERILDQ